MDTLKSNTLHQIGRVTLTIEHILDCDGDIAYLGKYTDSDCISGDQWLYHRASGTVTNDGVIWRNAKGHIQPTPELNRYGREYQYILMDNGQDCIKYVMEDAARLEDLDNGGWHYLGICAKVSYDGATIGRGALWGVESDSDEGYIRQTERDVAHEALAEARQWLTSNCR